MLHLDLEQLHIRGSLILAPRIRGFVRHLTITQYEHYMTHVNLLTYDSSLTRNDRDKCGSDLVHDNIELRRSRKSLSTLAFWGSLHLARELAHLAQAPAKYHQFLETAALGGVQILRRGRYSCANYGANLRRGLVACMQAHRDGGEGDDLHGDECFRCAAGAQRSLAIAAASTPTRATRARGISSRWNVLRLQSQTQRPVWWSTLSTGK